MPEKTVSVPAISDLLTGLATAAGQCLLDGTFVLKNHDSWNEVLTFIASQHPDAYVANWLQRQIKDMGLK